MKRTGETLAALLFLAAPAGADPLATTVQATAETEGTIGYTDDPTIWVDPQDPARSRILGTDRIRGLFVHGLDCAVRQFLPDGELNNVDVRPFTLAGREVGLAGATRRDDRALPLRGRHGPPHHPLAARRHPA